MSEYSLDTSLARDVWKTLDEFTKGYITAAMWTLTDDGHDCDHLGLHDISVETIEKAKQVCADFQQANADLLKQAGSDEQNGHDFLLTRDGHGSGFWDRSYGDIGRMLSDACKPYGGSNWYVGDDNTVYGE